MLATRTTALIIPALDEAATIADTVKRVDRRLIDEVIVVDNGSTDDTATVAQFAGASVVREPRRGYGSACLRGIAHAKKKKPDLLAFMDADGSDDPRDLVALFSALQAQSLDLVIGSRVLGDCEAGALTPVQRLGNALTCSLVHMLWGVRYTDLGPMRVIRSCMLDLLQMSDPDFGWTIEMQVKAAQMRLRTGEHPVAYRRRAAGKSKISGTLWGSYRAGRRILSYVAAAKVNELRGKRGV